MIPIGGAHLSVEERGQRRTLSGLSAAGPRAESVAWLEGSPAVLFSFFISVPFSFLISILFQILCILDSK
jgi:hypothetical protein